MIPLICLDVDGTLVGESGVVTDSVWAACAAATARGQHLALCTARGAFASSWDMATRLDPHGWHVFHAGGAAVHSETLAVRSHPLDPTTVAAAIAVAEQHSWVIELYSARDYVVASSHALAIEHAGLIGVPHRAEPLGALDRAAGGVVRIQYVVAESDVPAVTTATTGLGLTTTSATSPVMPGAAFVSLTDPNVTKATGIAMIAAELGLSMADVMMVGDGMNDLPALAAVGHPVAMGNAAPEIIDVAAHVVDSVSNDGVVEALELSSRL